MIILSKIHLHLFILSVCNLTVHGDYGDDASAIVGSGEHIRWSHVILHVRLF